PSRPDRARDQAARARAVRGRRLRRAVQPDGQLRARWATRRLRADRSQDHRRHLRRHGPPRWRRVQRQGPDEGRPLRRLRGAARGQEHRGGRHREPLRGAGRVRDRHRQARVGDGRDVRHVEARPREAAGARAGALRPPAGRDHRAAEPAPAHLPAHRGVRSLRSRRAHVHVGGHRRVRGAPQGRRGDRLNQAVQRVGRVLPDVPAVDRAFDYLVPNDAPHLRVGSLVRVPLHGRRVRGWVLELDVEQETAPDRLLPMRALVSDGPPADLVALSAWIAWRWAGSRALVLRACSPPNIVTPAAWPEPDVAVFPPVPSPVELHDAPRRVTCWPAATPRDDMVRALLAPEGSTIVIVPDSTEAAALALRVEADGRKAVLVSGDQTAAARTEAWREARRGACVVIGGRVAALSPVPDLAAAVVLDDADEALKEERVPAWHASTV